MTSLMQSGKAVPVACDDNATACRLRSKYFIGAAATGESVGNEQLNRILRSEQCA